MLKCTIQSQTDGQLVFWKRVSSVIQWLWENGNRNTEHVFRTRKSYRYQIYMWYNTIQIQIICLLYLFCFCDNLTSNNDIPCGVTTVFTFPTDHSAISLLNLWVSNLSTNQELSSEWSVYFNCLAYDWTIRNEWNVTCHDDMTANGILLGDSVSSKKKM